MTRISRRMWPRSQYLLGAAALQPSLLCSVLPCGHCFFALSISNPGTAPRELQIPAFKAPRAPPAQPKASAEAGEEEPTGQAQSSCLAGGTIPGHWPKAQPLPWLEVTSLASQWSDTRVTNSPIQSVSPKQGPPGSRTHPTPSTMPLASGLQ